MKIDVINFINSHRITHINRFKKWNWV